MVKKANGYQCLECHYEAANWLGKCPSCGSWNSLEKKESLNLHSEKSKNPRGSSQKIVEIKESQFTRYQTGETEFDRVMGGGIVKGSLTLIGGQPGVGKSTLLIEIMGKLSQEYHDQNILYISGEESDGQIASRARRLKIEMANVYVLNETNWQCILEELNKIKPTFIVIDSIQTMTSHEIASVPGSLNQIKEITYEIMTHVKSRDISCFVVGHITKDGAIAGPKLLEHMVDTVIYFEGEPGEKTRILRTRKNRYGDTNEIGIFEMNHDGLHSIGNPSRCFSDDVLVHCPGRSETCLIEGSRPFFIEIQSLVIENKREAIKRVTQGFDQARLSMLIAIIEKYLEIPFALMDVYLNIIGGFKVSTRDSDLSIVASLISSHESIILKGKTLFLGEVGLTGEVRSVPSMDLRLKEASLMNYDAVYTSYKVMKENIDKYPDLKINGMKTIKDFIDLFNIAS